MKATKQLRDRKFQESVLYSQVKQATKKLGEMNFSRQENRKFLISSFRELQKIVNKNYKYCSQTTEPDEEGKSNLVDLIINKSKIIEPYMVGDFNEQVGVYGDYQRVNLSKMDMACRVSNRECYEPKIKIDGELVFEYQNANMSRLKKEYDVYSCFKNSSFLLSIEVEPNCNLCFTKNGINPLLASQKDKFRFSKSYEQKIVPPCVICVVATSQYFRLPSRALTVVVKKTLNANDNKDAQKTGMIRPDWLDFGSLAYSRSNYSNISGWS